MNRFNIILSISIICLLILLGYQYYVKEIKEKYKDSGPILFYRITDTLNYKNPSLLPIQPITDILNDNIYEDIFDKTDNYKLANWIMFETFNTIDSIIRQIQFPDRTKFIYGLAGTDDLVSKSLLAIKLKIHLDSTDIEKIIPPTYVLENSIDKDIFINEYRKNNYYILKKNIQRQQGIIITQDRNIILNNFNTTSDFVVVQQMLSNPLLVNLRKVNIRVYLLVVVGGGNNNAMYMYNDGFMYYTPEFYKESTRIEENITTGYIDRKVYDDNPLTLRDLYTFLGTSKSAELNTNIISTMKILSNVYLPLFVKQNINFPGTKYLIYGVDLAPSSTFEVKIMEVNKGPDLSYKDKRDKDLKLNMVREALGIVGIMPKKGNKFILLK